MMLLARLARLGSSFFLLACSKILGFSSSLLWSGYGVWGQVINWRVCVCYSIDKGVSALQAPLPKSGRFVGDLDLSLASCFSPSSSLYTPILLSRVTVSTVDPLLLGPLYHLALKHRLFSFCFEDRRREEGAGHVGVSRLIFIDEVYLDGSRFLYMLLFVALRI